MKNIKFINYIFIFSILMGLSSCQLEAIENPNTPTRGSLIVGATLDDLQFVTTGLESVMRSDMEYYYWTVSSVGREYYDLRNTDPRYTGELLGKNDSPLDNNGFLTTRAYAQAFRVARTANDLITSVENSSTDLSSAQKEAIKGIAETYKVYSLLLELNRQYENGIRVDVVDPDNLGPFLSYQDSLAELRKILESAATKVDGVTKLPLSLQNMGISSVSDFVQFQNALLARIAMYQNDKVAVRSFLAKSFMVKDASMLNKGVFHPFGTSGNDIANPLFVKGDANYMAHPSFVADAETGDNRVANKVKSVESVSADDLSSGYRVSLYATNTTPVPLIRNEELILLNAEANIGTNNGKALELLNLIRNAAGLDSVELTTDAELVDELLKQRRYSLFGEGHRWIDLRRYNRLSELPIDRENDVVHKQFPRPFTEE